MHFSICNSGVYITTLLLFLIAFAVIQGSLAVSRHHYLNTSAYDLGIYVQALWLIAHGYPPFDTVRELHILGDHFTPVLYPLALIWRGGLGVEALLGFQAAALALGAWPLYRMGTRLTGDPRLGLLGAVSYLLYPALRSLSLSEFHPIALATPGLLFALDFALERRAVPMLVACGWSLLCKQEVSLVVACLGVWYAARWRQPRALGLTAAGIAWFVLATRLQAHFSGATESAYIELYSEWGRSTGEVLSTFLLTPWLPLASLGTPKTLGYLLLLGAPLAFLCLRSPGILWLLAFPLALNLFSNRVAMRQIHYQYTALLIPPLFTAALVTLARLRPEPRRRAAAAWAVAAAVCAFAVKLDWQKLALRPGRPAEEAAAVRRLLASLPRGASVSATRNLVPHLAERREVHLFPNPFWPLMTGPSVRALRQQNLEDFPAFDSREFTRRLGASGVEFLVLGHRPMLHEEAVPKLGYPWDDVAFQAAALRSPAYGLVRDEEGVWVLRRGADHAAGLRRLGLAPGEPPAGFEAVVAARRGVGRIAWPVPLLALRPAPGPHLP